MINLNWKTARTAARIIALSFPISLHAHEDQQIVAANATARAAEVVDCQLADETSALCHQIVVNYKPENLEIGPFCPESLDDLGGIWHLTGENEGLYRLDRSYFEMMDELGYRFYDEEGQIFISDIAVAQPTVDHSCINVSLDENVTMTMLVPVEPQIADRPTELGTVSKVGIAHDGVPIFSDAPSIQHTGHMPALDTCGGHVDPGGWYHWHAASTDIDTVFEIENVDANCALSQDPTAKFGTAFDGFAIYGSQDPDGSIPNNLDVCNGHVGMVQDGHEEVYHYHASTEFPNLPPCLTGVVAVNNFSTTAEAGIGTMRAGVEGSTRNEPPRDGNGGTQNGQLPPGFDEAAQKLGVNAQDLLTALHDAGAPNQLDISQAADALGVTENALRAALPKRP